MAHKLMLSAPFRGMPFIWNVNKTVGTETSDVNSATDVRLVKLLVAEGWKIPGAGSTAAPGCRVPPLINDTMDQPLGFWIYFNQVEAKHPADGTVSPSPKFPSDQYFILRFNFILFHNRYDAWLNLPNHPECGAMLKAELLAPPK